MMKNLEKYEKEIREILKPQTKAEIKHLLVDDIAINKETGEIMQCSISNCDKCQFEDEFGCDAEAVYDWIDAEVKENDL